MTCPSRDYFLGMTQQIQINPVPSRNNSEVLIQSRPQMSDKLLSSHFPDSLATIKMADRISFL